MSADAKATVIRWTSGAPPPDERSVRAELSSRGAAPYTWGNPPNDRYAAHCHPYHKVLVCLSGAITFVLVATGDEIELGPGDRLDLPPHVEHAALVGSEGVTCVEAHRSR